MFSSVWRFLGFGVTEPAAPFSMTVWMSRIGCPPAHTKPERFYPPRITHARMHTFTRSISSRLVQFLRFYLSRWPFFPSTSPCLFLASEPTTHWSSSVFYPRPVCVLLSPWRLFLLLLLLISFPLPIFPCTETRKRKRERGRMVNRIERGRMRDRQEHR